jgi:hypothetical protein
VVPLLCQVVASDPYPKVRHKAIPILLRLSDRDRRARAAIESAAASDDDALVLDVALTALESRAIHGRHALQR